MEPTIKIVSPSSQKGLGRVYAARPTIKDELNYIYIGALVTNAEGKNERAAEMVITATDESQNETQQGTGTFWGNPESVGAPDQPSYIYGYTYAFKTTGDHTITFACLGVTQEVTVNVPTNDNR